MASESSKQQPTFFESPQEWRAWLEANHASEHELLVGFHKVGSGRKSITWPDSVDQALCFGWIDGVRKRIDENSYTIRFTPRKPGSIWSRVNVDRVAELTKLGLMRPAGIAAFEARKSERTSIYSYERENAALSKEQEEAFRANADAWMFFQSQAPWYRRTVTYWVISAKREETRRRRLETLIQDSAHGRRVGQFTQYE